MTTRRLVVLGATAALATGRLSALPVRLSVRSRCLERHIFSKVLPAVLPSVLGEKRFYVSSDAGPSIFAGERCHENDFVSWWENDAMHEAAGLRLGRHAQHPGRASPCSAARMTRT